MHHQNHPNESAFSKKHHEIILNTLTEGILELTPEGAISYANPAAVSIIGISEDDLPGTDFADLFSGTTRHFRSTLGAGVPGHCPINFSKAYVREGNGVLRNGGHHRTDHWPCRRWLPE